MIADLTEPNAPKRQGKRRKITLEDMEAVCTLVVKSRLNETEAASLQGISQHQWFVYKQRAKKQAEFESICTRIRAANINAAITRIEKAGDDLHIETETGTIVKRGDWRADAWRAERVLAPERFADRRNDGAPQQPAFININLMTETLARLYNAQSKAVVECPASVQALPSAESSKA